MSFCMDFLEKMKDHLDAVEEKLGYVFQDPKLLLNALIHRSYLNEHRAVEIAHNERLEFLGDSVLGLLMAQTLYERLPSHPEGTLSQLRSKLVDAPSCANYLRKLELVEFILLGRGEQITEGKNKLSICADTFEAVVGAIYLDGGLAITRSFLLAHFEEQISEAIGNPPRNYKAELQDYSQRQFQTAPVYKTLEESGPDHAKMFRVVVHLNGQEAGVGLGRTKKEAEAKAAFEALSRLNL